MKPTILLTTALFLLSAPWPDSKTISELSAGFLSNTRETALLAAEVSSQSMASELSSSMEKPVRINSTPVN